MSAVTELVFLVHTQTREILYAGDVPEVYGDINGLANVDYSILKDLYTTWQRPRYQYLGFFTEADAVSLNVPATRIAAQKAAAWELKWNGLESTRNELIQAQRWRVDRYNDEVLQNRPPTENIQPVLAYIQAIRDLPVVYPDPYNIVWPTIPPLPGA